VIASLIGPLLPGFMAENPEVEVEVFADDGFTDIVGGGFDVGFRLGESLQADMVAVRVSPPFRFVVAGAPSYFAARGRPQRPEDLRDHGCIRFRLATAKSFYRWEFVEGNRPFEVVVDGPLIVNDTAVNVAAAVDGIGLCYVAEPLIETLVREGRLEIVLDAYAPPTPGLFVYFPSRAQALPKLRAFIDYMRHGLAEYARARG
jgi:DNA-binding transcriptional LysR family regulator